MTASTFCPASISIVPVTERQPVIATWENAEAGDTIGKPKVTERPPVALDLLQLAREHGACWLECDEQSVFVRFAALADAEVYRDAAMRRAQERGASCEGETIAEINGSWAVQIQIDPRVCPCGRNELCLAGSDLCERCTVEDIEREAMAMARDEVRGGR